MPRVDSYIANMPDNTPMEAIFSASEAYEQELDVLEKSSQEAAVSRSGLLLKACHKAGIKCVGDLKKTGAFRRLNREIERLAGTRAQSNNLKSTFRKVILNNLELGNICIPPGIFKIIREQKNRPCAPVQLTEKQIDFLRHSQTGRTPFLAARNNLIYEFELLYAIRPGEEITQIDNTNVHPGEGFMDILRKDRLMQRIYLRRDTCDHILKYRRLRKEVLDAAGETNPVIPFFIKERNV